MVPDIHPVAGCYRRADGGPISDLYEAEIAAWAEQQADALRRRAANEIDWKNVAEEIESLARSDRHEIRNRLAVICEHLLKWAYQPGHRSDRWRGSVVEARDQITPLVQESPSLRDYPAAVLAEAYPPGRRKAEAETGLGGLPESCHGTSTKCSIMRCMVEIENARSLRERPTNPDAFDLILRARSLDNLPPNLQRNDEALSLYERALSLDPTSAYATRMVAVRLINKSYPSWETAENMQRVETLVAQARAIAPDAEGLLGLVIQWYRKLERNQEAMAVAEDFIRRFPNNFIGYAALSTSKIFAGHAEEAIPLQEKAILLNPRSSNLFNRYRQLGFASLLLGRDKDAIAFLERSLAINPDDDGFRQWSFRFLAAAYAQAGELAAAKRAVAEADRLWPYDTVRSHWPDDLSSPVYAEQVRRLQAGLRLAGERDHADEQADFGVPSDATLRNDFAGLTPTTAPGAHTIRTTDLARFLALARPVVIDTVSYSWGRSVPGAVGLKFAGLGGSLADPLQDRLRSKMRELTTGDDNRPIVAVGWNSERFDGRNLALRLVALGYTQVYWYRGGREAWEVAGQPETELASQDW